MPARRRGGRRRVHPFVLAVESFVQSGFRRPERSATAYGDLRVGRVNALLSSRLARRRGATDEADDRVTGIRRRVVDSETHSPI